MATGPDSIFVGAKDLNSEPQALSISLAFWFILSLFSDCCTGPCVCSFFLQQWVPFCQGPLALQASSTHRPMKPLQCPAPSSKLCPSLFLFPYFNNVYPHSQIIRGVLNFPLHWDTNLPELSTCQTPSNAPRNTWDPEALSSDCVSPVEDICPLLMAPLRNRVGCEVFVIKPSTGTQREQKKDVLGSQPCLQTAAITVSNGTSKEVPSQTFCSVGEPSAFPLISLGKEKRFSGCPLEWVSQSPHLPLPFL